VSGTSFSDTALAPSTTHTYTVVAFDAAGNQSAPSATASATTQPAPDTQPPTAPTNLAATAVSASQINLAWTASTDDVGVAGYNVFRDGDATPIATVSGTSFSDTALAPSTTHSYIVVAFDAAGNQSPPSNAASATTQPPPAPVALLNPASLNFGSVKRGVTSAPQRVTVTNTGTATLTIASITLGGANPGDFAIAARTCGATLAPTASCTVDVTPFARGGKRRVAAQAPDRDLTPDATATPVGQFLPATEALFVDHVTSKLTSDCLVERRE
jgi:chitodextrinase